MRNKLLAATTAVASLAVFGAGAAHAAVLHGLTDGNTLITFDSNSPSVLANAVYLHTAGNAPIQDLIGIDFRPANNTLYGVGQLGAIYTIDPTTGVATQVSTLSTGLNGSRFGIDFNPAADRLRITSDTDQNLRINVDTGAVTVDGTLGYAPGDINAGRNPSIVAAAYTNSDNDVNTGTTLYVLDSVQNVLAIQNPPNNGTLNTVGTSNIDFSSVSGFDIGTDGNTSNVAFAALHEVNTGVTRLYRIDLTTGIAMDANVIGGGDMIDGLTIGVIPEPGTLALLGGGAALLLRRRSR